MKAEMDIGLTRRAISIRKARLDETNVDQQEARSFLARVDILGALERTVLISINLSKISLIIIPTTCGFIRRRPWPSCSPGIADGSEWLRQVIGRAEFFG